MREGGRERMREGVSEGGREGLLNSNPLLSNILEQNHLKYSMNVNFFTSGSSVQSL